MPVSFNSLTDAISHPIFTRWLAQAPPPTPPELSEAPLVEFAAPIALDDLPMIAAIVAVPVILALLAQWIIYSLLRKATSDRKRLATRKLVTHTAWPARILALFSGLTIAAATLDGAGLLPPAIGGPRLEVQTVAVILAITWLLLGLVAGADDMILARYQLGTKDNLKARRMHTQVAVISRLLMILIGVAGVSIALTTIDAVAQIGASLLASAGVAGIVLGLAAKPVLGNMLAGVQIAITQPIRLDDAVVINGEWGWIEEITITYVVVRIWDKRRLIVPLTKVIEEPFENWTRRTAQILGAVKLYVDYACPVADLRAELDRILEGHPLWDGDAKVLQVIDATEKTMVVRVLVTAEDSPTAWELRCDVREKLIDYLQRNHHHALPREREVEYPGDRPDPPPQPSY